MLAAGAAVPGVDPRLFAMLLCNSLGIMGVLTPYATGPSPFYFGSGHVARKEAPDRSGFVRSSLTEREA